MHQRGLPPRDVRHGGQFDRFVNEEAPRVFIDLLRSGYRVRSEAKGESMLPRIRPGDLLTVEPAPLSALRVGDIVVFGPIEYVSDTLTTHRVVQTGREAARPFIETRSDAEGWSGVGEIIFPEQVYGRIIRIQRSGISVWKASLWSVWMSGLRVRLRRHGGTLWRKAHGRPSPGPQKEFSPRENVTSKDLDCIYRQEPNVLFRAAADRAFLIPIRSGVADMEELLMLNPSGAHLWPLLDGRGSVGDLLEALTNHFEISMAQAELDLHQWLDELSRLKLIQLSKA
jgi:hypothetical protein